MMMSGHFGGVTVWHRRQHSCVWRMIICLSQVFKRTTNERVRRPTTYEYAVMMHTHHEHVHTKCEARERETRNQTLESIIDSSNGKRVGFSSSKRLLFCLHASWCRRCLLGYLHIIIFLINKINQTKDFTFQMNSNESERARSNSKCDTDLTVFPSFVIEPCLPQSVLRWWCIDVGVGRVIHFMPRQAHHLRSQMPNYQFGIHLNSIFTSAICQRQVPMATLTYSVQKSSQNGAISHLQFTSWL